MFFDNKIILNWIAVHPTPDTNMNISGFKSTIIITMKVSQLNAASFLLSEQFTRIIQSKELVRCVPIWCVWWCDVMLLLRVAKFNGILVCSRWWYAQWINHTFNFKNLLWLRFLLMPCRLMRHRQSLNLKCIHLIESFENDWCHRSLPCIEHFLDCHISPSQLAESVEQLKWNRIELKWICLFDAKPCQIELKIWYPSYATTNNGAIQR